MFQEREGSGVPTDELITVIFDSEGEYVRFVNHIFDEFGGRGLELTNVPVVTSICVRPWLLENTRDQFAMHRATEEEIAEVRRNLRASGRRAFDPDDLENFYIPGIVPLSG